MYKYIKAGTDYHKFNWEDEDCFGFTTIYVFTVSNDELPENFKETFEKETCNFDTYDEVREALNKALETDNRLNSMVDCIDISMPIQIDMQPSRYEWNKKYETNLYWKFNAHCDLLPGVPNSPETYLSVSMLNRLFDKCIPNIFKEHFKEFNYVPYTSHTTFNDDRIYYNGKY